MKLLYMNIPAQGHVNPSLPVVSELVRRGHYVVCYNGERFRQQIQATGAEFHPYHFDSELAPGADALTPFKAMPLILSKGEQVIERVLNEVRAIDPDAVIYDSMCVWGKQIAQILKRPAICSCTIFFIATRNFDTMPFDKSWMRQVVLGLPRVFLWTAEYYQIAFRIWRRWGVGSPIPFDFFGNPGDLTIVYTSRYFQVGVNRLDESFRFVGPSVAPRMHDTEFPFARLDGAPVIYVSLGTIFNKRPDFYRACMDAFADSPYHVVMAVGNKLDTAELGQVPENFIVRPSVPQLELLPRVNAFISHGGMNSVSESTWFGVPLVLFPQVGDQMMIARRVAQLGAGILLDDNHIDARAIRSATEKILDDERFRKASQTIGESLRAAGGYERAVDEIEKFILHNQNLDSHT